MTHTFLQTFWQDEQGQATTEYILMLSMLIALFLSFKKIMSKALQKLTKNLTDSLQNQFLKADLHHFRIGR
jgi:Flp pilus assembly pilin Flp